MNQNSLTVSHVYGKPCRPGQPKLIGHLSSSSQPFPPTQHTHTYNTHATHTTHTHTYNINIYTHTTHIHIFTLDRKLFYKVCIWAINPPSFVPTPSPGDPGPSPHHGRRGGISTLTSHRHSLLPTPSFPHCIRAKAETLQPYYMEAPPCKSLLVLHETTVSSHHWTGSRASEKLSNPFSVTQQRAKASCPL